MKSKIIKLINDYWRFDDDQDNLSTWHDKNDLIKEIEAIDYAHSSTLLKTSEKLSFSKWRKSKGLYYTKRSDYENMHGTLVSENDVKKMYEDYINL